MKKLKLFCVALAFILLMPYICYAQDSTDQTEIPIEDVSSAAPEFNGADEWTLPELTQAYELGLTTEKSMQKMSSSITREEFCELAVLFYEKYSSKEAAIPASNPFKDTTNPTILKAVRLGITNGFTPTSFNPAGFISKQDMAVMIVRAMKAGGIDTSVTTKVTAFMDANKIGKNALSSVEALQERGVLKGEKYDSVGGTDRYKLEPQGSISKQEAIILLKRTFEYSCMVRNASKWGPEVYIPKVDVGERYTISPEPVIIENDMFRLSILAGTAYDKNIEQRLLEMMNYIEVVTGLSFYPTNTEPKVEFIQHEGLNHPTGGYSGINIYGLDLCVPEVFYAANGILIHELLHCIMFRNVTDECIYDNSLTVFIEGYAEFLRYYIEMLYYNPIFAQMNIETNLLYFINGKLENSLINFSEDAFKRQTPTPLYDPAYQIPYVVGYVFCYYLNETYGIDVFKNIILSNSEFDPLISNRADTFIDRIKSLTSPSLFGDFAKWFEENKDIFNIKNSVSINGVETPLVITTSKIDSQYPSVFQNKYGHDKNRVMYIIDGQFILKDDFLFIDYTDAIAIAQNSGVDVRGLYIFKHGLKDVLSNGGQFKFYDANGDVIFNGLSDKLFDNVIEEDNYYVIYGAVRLVIYAKAGTRLFIYDSSHSKPDMFFSQD